MKLGIFSDTHLGFGSECRKEEAFQRFDEVINLFKEKEVDYILHAGDLFDHAVPDQETWLKTFECLNKNSFQLSKVKVIKNNIERCVQVSGIPIIAIHGTHEFRGKDFANALDILENANQLVHIHAEYALLEKNDEKVCVHGMGGIPEKMAKQALEKYAPEPIKETTNLLLLHQSFKEFLPFDDESIASLSLSDLPRGFDLIIDGHLHWSNEQNENVRFLLTGSTIYTQMKKLESEKEKGVFIFDTKTKELTFIPFKNQRKLFYQKLKFENAKPEEIIEIVESKINEFLKKEFELKPLIRLKLVGTLAKGFSQKDLTFSLSQKAIFSISKNFEIESFKKQINLLKKIQEEKKSVLEFGLNILEKNVEDAKVKIDTRRLFSLLSENELDKAEQILLKNN